MFRLAEGTGQRFCQPSGTLGSVRSEHVGDQLAASLPSLFIQVSLSLGLGLMSLQIGLRGGSNVELQPPRAIAIDRTAPEIDRSDFVDACVQMYRQGSGFAFAARPQHRADRGQRGHLFTIDGD